MPPSTLDKGVRATTCTQCAAVSGLKLLPLEPLSHELEPDYP